MVQDDTELFIVVCLVVMGAVMLVAVVCCIRVCRSDNESSELALRQQQYRARQMAMYANAVATQQYYDQVQALGGAGAGAGAGGPNQAVYMGGSPQVGAFGTQATAGHMPQMQQYAVSMGTGPMQGAGTVYVPSPAVGTANPATLPNVWANKDASPGQDAESLMGFRIADGSGDAAVSTAAEGGQQSPGARVNNLGIGSGSMQRPVADMNPPMPVNMQASAGFVTHPGTDSASQLAIPAAAVSVQPPQPVTSQPQGTQPPPLTVQTSRRVVLPPLRKQR